MLWNPSWLYFHGGVHNLNLGRSGTVQHQRSVMPWEPVQSGSLERPRAPDSG